ncbi:MAG: slipin family protein [Dehalococcoidales bacterium]|jgi:regulator of protease activity HflC (stomatin/prohibitin superfamily)|nr:slipin family protein [Dehalococcoidales bacterium]MDP6737739.1 slipin family protein [Dehalococcoidales bacterium]|tara:strand:+ start:8851 stop:9603 length:753 start_codon:yes stop_codon:yes gene_type:complete
MVLVGVIVFALIIILPSAIKIVSEWERGVILRLGRLVGAKGPGFFVIIPFVDRMIKVDLRTLPMDVPPQDVITKDNVTVRVDAVVYFRVIDPEAAVVKITDHIRATSLISQTTLRNVLGQSELDELLAQREMLNQNLQKIIDEQTDPWGVKVSIVEIKNVELPEVMRRSMASQAEAERERRAKIIHADGEFQASEKLAQAGAIVAQEPATLQLRYLQTLVEICSEKNSTIVFPLPIDLVGMFLKKQPPTS